MTTTNTTEKELPAAVGEYNAAVERELASLPTRLRELAAINADEQHVVQELIDSALRIAGTMQRYNIETRLQVIERTLALAAISSTLRISLRGAL